MRIAQAMFLVLTVAVALAHAAVPGQVSFQGRLTDPGGNLVPNANYTVVFTVYDAAVGGDAKWSETRIVATLDGLFTVNLGAVVPIDDSVFNTTTRYLGIQVGADPEISPRTAMVTVPFSFRTATIDGSTGGEITGDVAISGRTAIGPGHGSLGSGSLVAGSFNAASGDTSVVSGGTNNKATGLYSTVGGGTLNYASSELATVGGGWADSANGEYATVAGGYHNHALEYGASIGGGLHNFAFDDYAAIAGGQYNVAGFGATVSGGDADTAFGLYSAIGGGQTNTAYGSHAVISGGQQNRTNGGTHNAIGGGSINSIVGSFATIPGGRSNEAASYAFAAGRRAKAGPGCFVWGDSTDADIASTAANQFVVRATGGTTIYSAAGAAAGVELVPGSGAWASVSDRNAKENIVEVDYRAILNDIRRLPISRWNYKTQANTIAHIGPMAQDFHALFAVGHDDRTITTVDPDGVALAGIRAVADENEQLRKDNVALEARVAALAEELFLIRKQIEELSPVLGQTKR